MPETAWKGHGVTDRPNGATLAARSPSVGVQSVFYKRYLSALEMEKQPERLANSHVAVRHSYFTRLIATDCIRGLA